MRADTHFEENTLLFRLYITLSFNILQPTFFSPINSAQAPLLTLFWDIQAHIFPSWFLRRSICLKHRKLLILYKTSICSAQDRSGNIFILKNGTFQNGLLLILSSIMKSWSKVEIERSHFSILLGSRNDLLMIRQSFCSEDPTFYVLHYSIPQLLTVKSFISNALLKMPNIANFST